MAQREELAAKGSAGMLSTPEPGERRSRRRRGRIALLAAGIAALVAIAFTSAPAAQTPCTIEWDGGATGETDLTPTDDSWDNRFNWRDLTGGDVASNRLPNAGDHVCLPATTASAAVVHDEGTDS